MQITLQVEGHLRQYFPHLGEPTAFHLEGTPTVADILRAAKIPLELPGSVLCNRVRIELSETVADGAALMVLSPLAGG